jgi:hypothetical protein
MGNFGSKKPMQGYGGMYVNPALDEIRTIADLLLLMKSRPAFGGDYFGPRDSSDMRLEEYFDRTPYQQGRSLPPRLGNALNDDTQMQDWAGADPYGNPLPPTWARGRR